MSGEYRIFFVYFLVFFFRLEDLHKHWVYTLNTAGWLKKLKFINSARGNKLGMKTFQWRASHKFLINFGFLCAETFTFLIFQHVFIGKIIHTSTAHVCLFYVLFQGKCLCGQYIRARLKRAGFLNRKVTQRLRTMLDTPATLSTREIFPALNAVCTYMMSLENENDQKMKHKLLFSIMFITSFFDLADGGRTGTHASPNLFECVKAIVARCLWRATGKWCRWFAPTCNYF